MVHLLHAYLRWLNGHFLRLLWLSSIKTGWTGLCSVRKPFLSNYLIRLIDVWYWATTTLASVGYGDFSPKNNSEMIVCAFIFLIGVASFSFIMGNFIDMLMEFKTVTAENEDSAGLTKFFSLLVRFNKGRPLPKDIVTRIEEYFDYYWAKDLNYAMKSESDKRFISELPKDIRINVCPL